MVTWVFIILWLPFRWVDLCNLEGPNGMPDAAASERDVQETFEHVHEL